MRSVKVIRFIFHYWIFLFIFSLLSFQVVSQNIRSIQYRVSDGLPNDFIKSTVQDKSGFLWIGTDEGIVRYNGIEFSSFPGSIPSPYVKFLLKTSGERILAVTDLGIVEIRYSVDSTWFSDVIRGYRNPSDTSVWYPKSLFEDPEGNLWISEPQSVVRLKDGGFKRYPFGAADNSTSFVRSFNFAMTPDGNLLVSTYTGNLYVYDPAADQFRAVVLNSGLREINHIIRFGNDILLAGYRGLHKLSFGPGHTPELTLIYPTSNLSYLLPLNDSTLAASSFAGRLFYVHYRNGNYEIDPVADKFPPINHISRTEEGNLWLSTEKGVILLQNLMFQKIVAPLEFLYVESISPDLENECIYFTSMENIWALDLKSMQVREVFFDDFGYFLSMEKVVGGFWVSNVSKIEFFRDERMVFEKDFINEGRSIFDMNQDAEGSCWFTQEGFRGVRKITSDFQITTYNSSNGILAEPTVVRFKHEDVYLGTYDPSHYLLYMQNGEDHFIDLSLPLPFETSSDLRIDDITFTDEAIWLATTSGLLKLSENEVCRISLFNQTITEMHVKSAEAIPGSPFILFCNSLGLFQLNSQSGEVFFYNENSGLPSNVINARGIEVDELGRIWLGTAGGLAFTADEILQTNLTRKPVILSIYANDQKVPARTENQIFPPRTYINFEFCVLQYPTKGTQYSYRLSPRQENWSLPSMDPSLSFTQLKPGSYLLEIRAKKDGNYSWSEASIINFKIEKEFYQTSWFYILVILFALGLIWVSFYLTSLFLRKRQRMLELLVKERTRELEQANINLAERNKELDQFVYSASHDMSAPLKSILGLINIAHLEITEKKNEYIFRLMEKSIKKLEIFIRDITNYSRNTRLQISHDYFKPYEIIKEILEDLSNYENYARIRFHLEMDQEYTIYSDYLRFKIILNNLLSNAIKFVRDEEPEPYVRISLQENTSDYVLRVEDNGQGIPEQYQQKIFEMFYRANLNKDGSGLGLYILKETVHKLNGQVELKSASGVGSTFTINLPKNGEKS